MSINPLVLIILDGWGYSEDTKFNAIAQANTPQWDAWWRTQPHLLLDASGTAVGLPDKQMGNSEVGHMHIGAGRVIMQDFTRINHAIANGEFSLNSTILSCINDCKQDHTSLHIMGLLSPGGVHSHEDHLLAILKLCAEQSFTHVCLHLFLDGRDCPPQSALNSIEKLNGWFSTYPVGKIGSISGRYYAMDRDRRWERTQNVYDLLTEGKAKQSFSTAEEAINAYYQNGVFDEFIPPTLIGKAQPIAENDSLLFYNYRADRARQLTQAFVDPNFNDFERDAHPTLKHFISMTQYAKNLRTECIFPPQNLKHTLGEVIAAHGLKQLRMAETEKYAHVTFFLNGGIEQPFTNEERILVQSPMVKTYDLQPEMSCKQLTKSMLKAINEQAHSLIVCNFANPDMIGHTGDFNACIKAIETIDEALKQIGNACINNNTHLLITADHGNAECMFNPNNNQAHTAHTLNPVPFLYVGNDWKFNTDKGSLIDVAPTALRLLGIQPPQEMTGQPLMVEK